jgi:RNA polymerase sigma-70 factor, ECF subfamily
VPPAVASTDADLILAIVHRDDRRAFAELVARHQSRVRALLRRLTKGDLAAADDLAQETFLLAWRKLPSFRFEARFSTWLYRIALNCWRSDARKRHDVVLDLDEEGDAHEVAVEDRDPSVRVDLARAIAALSDGERACIAACYYADLSHDEAAEMLGLPLGTVKTHILRAKAKLKQRLGDEENDP